MTVSTVPYYEWNRRNDSLNAPYNACSPNLVALQSYYRRRWGSSNLGCHVQRVISGSSSLSSHAWGAATDDRFPNRQITLAVMAWLVDWSAELGINTIHDYAQQRKWDPLVGWHSASIGSVGGDWIHVETTPAMFLDARPVEDKLTGSETDVPVSGEDAKLVAAVMWETILERNGVKAPARVWLTEARDFAVEARDIAAKAADNAADATQWAHWSTDWATKASNTADDIQTTLDGFTVPGGNVEALAAVVRQIIHEELGKLGLSLSP